jgi:hypothetical protein
MLIFSQKDSDPSDSQLPGEASNEASGHFEASRLLRSSGEAALSL